MQRPLVGDHFRHLLDHVAVGALQVLVPNFKARALLGALACEEAPVVPLQGLIVLEAENAQLADGGAAALFRRLVEVNDALAVAPDFIRAQVNGLALGIQQVA